MISAITPNITIAVPTVRPPCFRSPQPICCPSRIVVPMAKLLTRLVSGFRILPWVIEPPKKPIVSSSPLSARCIQRKSLLKSYFTVSIFLSPLLHFYSSSLYACRLNILIFINDIFLSYHKLLCLSSHIKLL